MVISNSTLELINTVSDINIEYNIKLIIFFGTLIMAAISLYFSTKLDRDNPIQDLAFYGMYWFGLITYAFAPLYVLILQRTVPLGVITNLIVGFYVLFVSILILLGVFWFGKRFVEKFFNIKFGEDKRTHRDSKEYRRVE